MANYTLPYNFANITSSNPGNWLFQISYYSNGWVAHAVLIIIFVVAFIYTTYKQDSKSIYSSFLISSAITWGISVLMVVWRFNGESLLPVDTSLTLLVITGLAFFARKLVKE